LFDSFEPQALLFLSLLLLVEEFAFVIKLFAAGCSPAVGAQRWFQTPPESERLVCWQIVCSASIGGTLLDAGVAIEVVGSFTVLSFTVLQFVSVLFLLIASLRAGLSAAAGALVALRAGLVGFVFAVRLILICLQAVIVAECPIVVQAHFALFLCNFFLQSC
jgi:hypothetical protein